MKTLAKHFIDAVVIVTVIFLLFEVTLRIVPTLIPLYPLEFFNPQLRTSIAKRVDLPLEENSRLIKRDDGGPELWINKPNITIPNKFPEDIPFGAVDITTDENGFCNTADMSYDREQIDIITIGDSFTHCANVLPNQIWPALLDAAISESVYNLGHGSKGLYEYIQILKTFGLQKRPKMVIMAAFEGNDLSDAQNYWAYRERGEVQKKQSADDCKSSSCRAYMYARDSVFGRNSYAFNLLISSARVVRGTLIERANDKVGIADFTYYIADERGNEVPFNRANVSIRGARLMHELNNGETPMSIIDEALETFRALADEHGFEPVLVYIPTAHTAYADHIQFADSRLKDIVRDFSDTQRVYYQKKAEELDISFFDTTPALQRAAPDFLTEERLLYFPTNMHLVSYGNQVVSDFIFTELREEHLLY